MNEPAKPAAGSRWHLQPYRTDPRFSFALSLPGGSMSCLLVVVHDSTRDVGQCLDAFASFAMAHDCAVLAPLFPANVRGDGSEDGYKLLIEGDIHYDRVLNGMVDQAAADMGCPDKDLLLHGYSGGGQFAHRYWLLHPQRLRAVVIGAPGEVTLLDDQIAWWGGVQDSVELFERAVDPRALRQVPACLLVGELDTQTDELTEQPPSGFWVSDAARLSSNRKDRLSALHRSLQRAGVHTHFELLPGASHATGALLAVDKARQFLGDNLPPASR